MRPQMAAPEFSRLYAIFRESNLELLVQNDEF